MQQHVVSLMHDTSSLVAVRSSRIFVYGFVRLVRIIRLIENVPFASQVFKKLKGINILIRLHSSSTIHTDLNVEFR